MNGVDVTIFGRKCILYSNPKATHLLIQPIDVHDLRVLDKEVEAINNLTETPFSLLAFLIEDWNSELTPWSAPAVFGTIPFGDGAGETLKVITEQLLPKLTACGFCNIGMKLLLGGYSLAGLFTLWSAYQTDMFDGVVAASPSVWFPKWIEYATKQRMLVKSIYLSLGDKEEKTKNTMMAQVGDAIRKQFELLTGQGFSTVLEWNTGNHFVGPEKRMAKGFAWLLNLGNIY